MSGPVGTKASKRKGEEQRRGMAREHYTQPEFSNPQADLVALQRGVGNRTASRLLQPDDSTTIPEPSVPSVVMDAVHSPGQPLDPTTRAFMESRFEYDFRQVRVHTDETAAGSARTMNALAYTLGKDVVFGEGQYAPKKAVGRRVLAHELAHVVQQSNVTPISSSIKHIFQPSNVFECEAEQVASVISKGATKTGCISILPMQTIQLKKAPSKLTTSSKPRSAAEMAREKFEKLRDGYAKELGVGKGGEVHHATELDVLDIYPGVYTEEELNHISNMRGIPSELMKKRQLHASDFRRTWNRHYRELNKKIRSMNLSPDDPEYKSVVRSYLGDAVKEIDAVRGQFYTTERRKPKFFPKGKPKAPTVSPTELREMEQVDRGTGEVKSPRVSSKPPGKPVLQGAPKGLEVFAELSKESEGGAEIMSIGKQATISPTDPTLRAINPLNLDALTRAEKDLLKHGPIRRVRILRTNLGAGEVNIVVDGVNYMQKAIDLGYPKIRYELADEASLKHVARQRGVNFDELLQRARSFVVIRYTPTSVSEVPVQKVGPQTGPTKTTEIAPAISTPQIPVKKTLPQPGYSPVTRAVAGVGAAVLIVIDYMNLIGEAQSSWNIALSKADLEKSKYFGQMGGPELITEFGIRHDPPSHDQLRNWLNENIHTWREFEEFRLGRVGLMTDFRFQHNQWFFGIGVDHKGKAVWYDVTPVTEEHFKKIRETENRNAEEKRSRLVPLRFKDTIPKAVRQVKRLGISNIRDFWTPLASGERLPENVRFFLIGEYRYPVIGGGFYIIEGANSETVWALHGHQGTVAIDDVEIAADLVPEPIRKLMPGRYGPP